MKKISPFAKGDKVNYEMLVKGAVATEIPAVFESVTDTGLANILIARKKNGSIEAVNRAVPENAIKRRDQECSHEDSLTM